MIKFKKTNIIAFLILLSMGGFIAGKQEMEARGLEREIRERRKENLAKVPVIEEKLKDESLSQEDRRKLEKELDMSKKGMPNIPHYFPYNERIVGWPLEIALTLGGFACLFIKS